MRQSPHPRHRPLQLPLILHRRRINYEALAKAIRQQRHDLGWTREEVREHTGINATTLWQIEMEPDKIPFKQFSTIYYLLSFLGIDLEDPSFTL
jgi:hypothetical protein